MRVLVRELRVLDQKLLDHLGLQLNVHVHSLWVDVETGSLLGGGAERIASLVTPVQDHHFLSIPLHSLDLFVLQSHGVLASMQLFSHTLHLPVLALKMLIGIVKVTLKETNLLTALGFSRRGRILSSLVAILGLLFEEISLLL